MAPMTRPSRWIDLAPLVVGAAFLAGACQAGAPTDSPPGGQTTGGPEQAESESPETSADAAPDTSPDESSATGSSDAGVVVTIKSIGTRRWGDDNVKASGTASDGEPLKYTASGDCEVNGKSGAVDLIKTGSCTITATTTASAPPVSASARFKIDPARPVIHFGAKHITFRRALSYRLAATVSPSIPLRFEVIRGASGTSNDSYCAAKDGRLVWTRTPTVARHPSVPAACMVRVSAAKTSDNYVAPKPVQALVSIGYPTWKVDASNQTVSLAAIARSDGTHHAKVKVSEDTGDTLGMLLNPNGDAGPCDLSSTGEAKGTNSFTFDVLVTGTGVCHLEAQAEPQDWDFQGKGTSVADFTLTVKP